MRLLLDTHVVLWWLTEPATLKKSAHQEIANADNIIFVSAASIWEIAIKQKLDKVSVPHQFLDVLKTQRIGFLAIEAHHALTVMDLPDIHQDPFDRMLVAQSKCEELVLVTRDKVVAQYPIKILKA